MGPRFFRSKCKGQKSKGKGAVDAGGPDSVLPKFPVTTRVCFVPDCIGSSQSSGFNFKFPVSSFQFPFFPSSRLLQEFASFPIASEPRKVGVSISNFQFPVSVLPKFPVTTRVCFVPDCIGTPQSSGFNFKFPVSRFQFKSGFLLFLA